MNRKSLLITSLTVFSLFLIPGCGQQTTVAKKLQPLCFADYDYTNNGITLKAKKLSAQETFDLFGKHFIKKNSHKSIHAVEFEITNHTSSSIVFTKNNIHTKIVAPYAMRKKFNKATVTKALSSLFLIPVPILNLVITYKVVKNDNIYNTNMNNFFSHYLLYEPLYIAPHATEKCIAFIRDRNLQLPFDATVSGNNETTNFSINLK